MKKSSIDTENSVRQTVTKFIKLQTSDETIQIGKGRFQRQTPLSAFTEPTLRSHAETKASDRLHRWAVSQVDAARTDLGDGREFSNGQANQWHFVAEQGFINALLSAIVMLTCRVNTTAGPCHN